MLQALGPVLCGDRLRGETGCQICCAPPACLRRRRSARSAYVRRTCLPQKDADHLGRCQEADSNAALYSTEWRDPRGVLPPVCEAVPQLERGEPPLLSAGPARRAPADGGWASFAEIDRAYNSWRCRLPPVSQRWADDAEFGRQRLCGLCPSEVRLVEGCLPPHVAAVLSDDQLTGLLEGHRTLSAAIAAGRLYCVDLSAKLGGVHCQEGWHLCAPTLLLYFTDTRALLPIAIQLHPPGSAAAPDAGVVYTPNDNIYAWTLAKLHFQSAELHWLLFAKKAHDIHAIGAFVASATYRTLSTRHPVRQALAPFLAGAVAAHRYLNETLLADGGAVDRLFACGAAGAAQIARRARAAYSFMDASFVHDVRRRMLDRERELRYPLLEDGVLVWEAIERYARGVITRFYTEPADLTNDGELNAWVSDIKRMVPSVPHLKEYTTDPLVFIVANVIWLCTAGHSVWRGDLYGQLGYLLNRPFRLRPPPAKPADAITEQDVLASLAAPEAVLQQINFVQQMAAGWAQLPRLDGTEGGEPVKSPHVAFADEHAQGLYTRFVEDMVRIEEVIQLRNSERTAPYTALLPSEIASTLCL
eukprot:TRINITY_DN15427_c0_g1_i1.p1 TRINITY_DN15427_c0_g1~~TRINITY_DN15427_c0_g1_i1.p1  ORF type:complete len:587 (+),score=196.28 TRINITY_DN15427_c0_g1_i1:67-1827(+)